MSLNEMMTTEKVEISRYWSLSANVRCQLAHRTKGELYQSIRMYRQHMMSPRIIFAYHLTDKKKRMAFLTLFFISLFP